MAVLDGDILLQLAMEERDGPTPYPFPTGWPKALI